jgi:mRNA interferase MazF
MGLMPKPVRGEVWAVDFEPQAHKEEPGKKARPALIIQTDALNNAGHQTVIVIPGTSDVETPPPSDAFPLRVRVQKTGKLKYDTDLLIDQVRAISIRRLMYCYCMLGANHLKKVEEALRLLTGR